MTGEKNHWERIYQLVLRFSVLGIVAGLALVIYLSLHLVRRLENLAPAEMRLLLGLLKNRFFQ